MMDDATLQILNVFLLGTLAENTPFFETILTENGIRYETVDGDTFRTLKFSDSDLPSSIRLDVDSPDATEATLSATIFMADKSHV